MAFQDVQAYASAARTATPTSVEVLIEEGVEMVEVLINTTAVGVTPSTVVNIDFQDSTGAWVLGVLASAALTAVGTVRMLVGKSVTTTANLAIQAVLPRAIRVRPVHGNGVSHTYNVAVRGR